MFYDVKKYNLDVKESFCAFVIEGEFDTDEKFSSVYKVVSTTFLCSMICRTES